MIFVEIINYFLLSIIFIILIFMVIVFTIRATHYLLFKKIKNIIEKRCL